MTESQPVKCQTIQKIIETSTIAAQREVENPSFDDGVAVFRIFEYFYLCSLRSPYQVGCSSSPKSHLERSAIRFLPGAVIILDRQSGVNHRPDSGGQPGKNRPLFRFPTNYTDKPGTNQEIADTSARFVDTFGEGPLHWHRHLWKREIYRFRHPLKHGVVCRHTHIRASAEMTLHAHKLMTGSRMSLKEKSNSHERIPISSPFSLLLLTVRTNLSSFLAVFFDRVIGVVKQT